MRTIISKYAGECQECSEPVAVGEKVVYERGIGVFHPHCAPTDAETIREYRADRAERKASRYEEWADKRRAKAVALEKQNEPYRGDHAFNTQPGHIPERARVNRRSEKAFEHSTTADRFNNKAERLRNGVRVEGDAEAKRQKHRDIADTVITIGDYIETGVYGPGIVQKVNKNTYTCSFRDGAFKQAIDKAWARLIEKREPVKEEHRFKPGDPVVAVRGLAKYPGTVKRRTARGYSVEYDAFGRVRRETFSPWTVFADMDEATAGQKAVGLS